MCFFLYIAADHLLRTTQGCDDPKTGFHVIAIEEDARIVGRLLRRKYVVYAGAQGGCGCGFLYESDAELKDLLESLADAPASVRKSSITERDNRKAQVDQLRAYLREAVTMGPTEVLATWSEIKPPKNVIEVEPERFGGNDGFEVEEDWLYRINR